MSSAARDVEPDQVGELEKDDAAANSASKQEQASRAPSATKAEVTTLVDVNLTFHVMTGAPQRKSGRRMLTTNVAFDDTREHAAKIGKKHPSKMLSKPPKSMPKTHKSTWANVLIHREHPLMQLIAHPGDPVQCIWYDDVLDDVMATSPQFKKKNGASRHLVDAINGSRGCKRFKWLPSNTHAFCLPSARRPLTSGERFKNGHRTEISKVFPVFLLPFMRVFELEENMAGFDIYVLSVSHQLRDVAERSKSPPDRRTYSQFIANMNFAKNANTDLVYKNVSAVERKLTRGINETKHTVDVQLARQEATIKALETANKAMEARLAILENQRGVPKDNKRRKTSVPRGAEGTATKRARKD